MVELQSKKVRLPDSFFEWQPSYLVGDRCLSWDLGLDPFRLGIQMDKDLFTLWTTITAAVTQSGHQIREPAYVRNK